MSIAVYIFFGCMSHSNMHKKSVNFFLLLYKAYMNIQKQVRGGSIYIVSIGDEIEAMLPGVWQLKHTNYCIESCDVFFRIHVLTYFK